MPQHILTKYIFNYKKPSLSCVLGFVFVFMCVNNNIYGQIYSNKRMVQFAASDSVVLDSMGIIPGTFVLYNSNGDTVSSDLYIVNYSKSVLKFTNVDKVGELYTAFYRVFSYKLSGVYQPIKPVYDTITGTIRYDGLDVFNIPPSPYDEENRIVVTGNISRGITAGNGQNAVMNSNMNLQLTGNIDDNIKIEAYLSDKNVPIQPDGYSQQINRFDQIYIRLYDTARYLQMGDVDINGSNSYFLKFNRKLLGGDFAGTVYSSNETEVYTHAGAAIAKGTFRRLEFKGIEGVQGPYRLTGANNEQYITVLAGSEKVFVDGQLLSRGENAHYVIDYNTAEVTFMPSFLITKDSRIIIEYEYSNRKYNKFLLYGQTGLKHKKTKLNIQYFSEGDSKNQPVEQSLPDYHKIILSESGDNTMNAVVPGFDSIGYEQNRVMYAIKDTIIGSEYYDTVLYVSTNASAAVYSAEFAFVGQGNGNYIRSVSNINGRAYEWVAPLNGVLQGNYEPVRILTAPKRLQVFVFNTEQQIGALSKVQTEVALSNNNLNTFSDKDSYDDVGFAINAGAEHTFDFLSKKLKVYGKYDFIQKYFATPERFREAEFNRNWNIDEEIKSNQHMAEAGVVFFQNKNELASFIVQRLINDSYFNGLRINSNVNIGNEKNSVNASSSYLVSDDIYKSTIFYRHNTGYVRTFPVFKTGVEHNMEYNKIKAITNDTLLASSEGKSSLNLFITNNDHSKVDYKFKYANIVGLYPRATELEHLTTAHEYSTEFGIGNGATHRLNATATYRELIINDSALLQSIKNRNSFVGRFEHNIKIWQQTISLSTFYELGSGMEAEKEYYYIEVPMGQGVYVWVDYNGNNSAELNEFEQAKFVNEANYIRVYTQGTDYIQTFMLKFNETLRLDFSKVWYGSSGIKGFMSRFSNSTSYRMNQKQTSNNIERRLNPFGGNIYDSTLITQSLGWRNNLSFNRRGTVWGFDYIYQTNENKSLLLNGFEQSLRYKHELHLRWNIIETLTLQPLLYWGKKNYESEYFKTKNYSIAESFGESMLQWQPNTKFRLSMTYSYLEKKNSLGGEFSIIQSAGPELKINAPGKGTVTAGFLAIHTLFTGVKNSQVRYEMLDGYMPGVNYRWNANVSHNLNEFLRLTFIYNGRAGSGMEAIHTGQLSIVAFF